MVSVAGQNYGYLPEKIDWYNTWQIQAMEIQGNSGNTSYS